MASATRTTADDFHTTFQNAAPSWPFSGHVMNRTGPYKVEGAFYDDGGDFNLEDAFIGYNFGNGWRMKMGQFKVPFLREELRLQPLQLAVERSVVNELFNQDRSQGIELRYEADAGASGPPSPTASAPRTPDTRTTPRARPDRPRGVKFAGD